MKTTEPTYIAVAGPASEVAASSWRKVPFATGENPDNPCGMAVRVGRAGTRESDPPVYRLKLKTGLASFKTAVLPGFFVLKEGVFIPCERWQRRQRKR